MFRALRVLRLFKLSGDIGGSQVVLRTLGTIIPMLSNMVVLALVVLFIFGVAATGIFAVG